MSLRAKLISILGLILVGILSTFGYGYYELFQARKIARGAPQLAMVSYEHAARLLIWRKDLWEMAGISAFDSGNYDEAIRLFSIAREQNMLSAEAWGLFGTAYWMKSEPDRALQVWQGGVEKYISNVGLYDNLAMGYHVQGDYASEQDALTTRLTLEDNAQIRYRLGILLTLTDSRSAINQFKAASDLDPQFDPAAQTLTSALDFSSIQPDESTRLVAIGRGLGLVNEWGTALRAFEGAREADQNNPEAWAWLGEAKQQTGADGRAELDHALDLDPQSAIVRGLRGLYWKRQSNYSKALVEYKIAFGLEPENPAWLVAIGETYVQLGDLSSALEQYQSATAVAPGESTYWRLLATFCVQHTIQLEDVGLPAAQKAVELAADDVPALDVLGWTYMSSGRLALAEETLQMALKKEPDFASAHLHLGMTYLAQANPDVARTELERARDINPNDPVSQFAEQLLKQYFP
jgi:tetratricopeptide (TPR) repeat protein